MLARLIKSWHGELLVLKLKQTNEKKNTKRPAKNHRNHPIRIFANNITTGLLGGRNEAQIFAIITDLRFLAARRQSAETKISSRLA